MALSKLQHWQQSLHVGLAFRKHLLRVLRCPSSIKHLAIVVAAHNIHPWSHLLVGCFLPRHRRRFSPALPCLIVCALLIHAKSQLAWCDQHSHAFSVRASVPAWPAESLPGAPEPRSSSLVVGIAGPLALCADLRKF